MGPELEVRGFAIPVAVSKWSALVIAQSHPLGSGQLAKDAERPLVERVALPVVRISCVRAVPGVVELEKAGGGNRTRVTSLEGWSSTIELRPRGLTEE
jgi:hypothetical protein